MDPEVWKTIEGYELYEVSSRGNVRRGSKLLKPLPVTNQRQYKSVMLYNNPKRRIMSIHRLMALAFIPNDEPETKIWVNHKNGNKLNNNLSNLEWCTPKENTWHMVRELKRGAPLANKAVLQIDTKTNEVIRRFDSMKQAADALGLYSANISRACRVPEATSGGFKWSYEQAAEVPSDGLTCPGWDDFLFTREGRMYSLYYKRYMNPCVHRGIAYIPHQSRNGIERRLSRVIARLYVPNPNNHPFVLHRDGNSLNNTADNLEWSDRTSIAKSPSIPITQWTMSGDYVQTFTSSRQAQKMTGIWACTINKVCKGEAKQAGGFLWSVATEF